MRRRGTGAAPLALLGIALACGSGGGGNGSGATAEITAANAETITSQVLLGIELSAEESTIAAGLLLAEVGPTLTSAAGVSRTAAPALDGSTGIAPNAAIGPTTEDCAAGGSVTFSGERAQLDQPSVGDRLSLVYDQCDAGNGDPVLDGSLDYVIVAIVGDITSDAFAVRIDVDFGEFVQTGAEEEIEADGAATASYDARTPPTKKSFIAGPQLTLCVVPTGTNQPPCLMRADARAVELQDFDTSLIDNLGVDAVDGHGLLASLDVPPVFEGQVAFDTVTPLAEGHADDTVDDEIAGGEFIVGGDLLITGASGATIRLVELEDPNVELLVDLDGDGETDLTIDTTWDALQG